MRGLRLAGAVLAALACLPALGQTAPVLCVAGSVGKAPVATISFTAPTISVDGVTPLALPLTYNLYQSETSATEVKVASALAGLTIPVTTGLLAKQTFYWKVSVTDANGLESALSAEVCKTFPGVAPGTVINITVS